MRYDVLGPLEVRDGALSVAVGPPQRRAVLGVLLASANRFVSRDRVIESVWPGRAGPERVGSVQSHVSRLRGVLGASVIVHRAQGYLLRTGPDDLDADRFGRAVDEGTRLCLAGEPAAGRDVLADALALWRGDAFEDFRYDDWAQPDIRRLTELRWEAVQARLDAELRMGRHAGLVSELEVLVDDQPGRERLCALLMLALYRCGRQGDALAAYRRWRDRLCETAGLAPSPPLRRLEQQILRHDPELLCTTSRPKDQPRSGWSPGPRRGNLPVPLTSFVGRVADLAAVADLVAARRLVTLVGPGGVGKTRLALRVADGAAGRRPDGVWWVDLAAVSDSNDVVAAVRAALGFVPDPHAASPLEGLLTSFEERDLLLVLDCCEPATAAVADFAGRLLRRCPGARVLCTSREPLAVLGEQVWPVPPLDLSDATQRDDALALFLDRAAGTDPALRLDATDLAAATEVCRRVDGLPLGIEIAAAQVRDLTPSELLERLGDHAESWTAPYRDLPPRHRSLATTIAWSYDLLRPPLRQLLAALAVPEPPLCAADVTGADLAGDQDADAALRELADKSLLVRTRRDGHTHYRMLDTVRAVAGAVLDRSGQRAAVTARLARHFAGLAATGHSPPDDGLAWVVRVRAAEPNIAAALRWCLEHDPALGARSFLGLQAYLTFVAVSPEPWVGLGHELGQAPGLDERTRLRLAAVATLARWESAVPERALAQARAVLDHPDACPDAKVTALRALVGLAEAGWDGDGPDSLRRYGAQWIDMVRRTGTPEAERTIDGLRFTLAYLAGDLDDALRHMRRAVARTDVRGTALTLAFFLRNIADVQYRLGDTAAAVVSARAALAAAEAVGSPPQRAMALTMLAEILTETAPAAEALAAAVYASTVAYEIDSHLDLVDGLTALASCCVRLGRYQAAARVYGVVLRRCAVHGVPRWHHITADRLHARLTVAGQPPPAAADLPVPVVLAEATAG